jgi:hypothetical protein
LIALYAILVFLLPSNQALVKHYHLSPVAIRFLDITVVIPLILIWSTAYYGYSMTKKYASTIIEDKDGVEISKISNGIAVLAFGGPINSIISTITNYIAHLHGGFLPKATIINNYSSLTVAFVGFIIIGGGARGLADTVKLRTSYKSIQNLAVVVIILVTIFTYLIFHTLPQSLKLGISPKPSYYLPDDLLIFTIVIPYIYLWFIGGMAAMDLYGFYKKVKGIIYKQSMKYMAIGVSFLVVTYVVLQYLTTLSAKLYNLKLASLLLVVYPLLILISVGYVLVAIGSKKLNKIEES